ncbi:hypothetical protein ILYODFUR_033946 [Ilyodon furcidens]|uniref:Uncharacterized protein n=1 Tax=Ilyodon furcidens TaxID=33524 RepID=A0ABV0VK11_9TELE
MIPLFDIHIRNLPLVQICSSLSCFYWKNRIWTATTYWKTREKNKTGPGTLSMGEEIWVLRANGSNSSVRVLSKKETVKLKIAEPVDPWDDNHRDNTQLVPAVARLRKGIKDQGHNYCGHYILYVKRTERMLSSQHTKSFHQLCICRAQNQTFFTFSSPPHSH